MKTAAIATCLLVGCGVRTDGSGGAGESGLPGDSTDTETGENAAVGKRDVVVVVLDTARYQLLEEGALPLLTARTLTGETVVNMTGTAGWTRPATTSLMSGLRWEELYLRGGAAALEEDAVETLPESLEAAGWYTYLDSANIALSGWLKQGFDESHLEEKSDESAAQPYQGVLDTIAAKDEAVFAWVQLMELHVPFGPMAPSCQPAVDSAAAQCPEELFDIGEEVTYAFIDFKALSEEDQAACGVALHLGQACAATQADLELSAFLDALPADALVAITTDHGEGWLDPKTDHNWTLNQKITRGFLALFDNEAEPREYAMASQVDLAPTLLDRLGVPAPNGQYEGVPLGQTPSTPLTAWRCAPQSLTVETALWSGDIQAIRIRRPGGKEAYELYNTLSDPHSDTDLSATEAIPPEVLEVLDASFDRTEALCVEGSDW
jgi:arylsulfatase A-like enzyme